MNVDRGREDALTGLRGWSKMQRSAPRSLGGYHHWVGRRFAEPSQIPANRASASPKWSSVTPILSISDR